MKTAPLSTVVIAVLFLTSCDAFTSIRGEVRGTDCLPVVGATITMKIDEQHPSKGESDIDGSFEIQTVHGKTQEILLVVSKPGYKEKVIRLHPYFQYEDIVVILELDQDDV